MNFYSGILRLENGQHLLEVNSRYKLLLELENPTAFRALINQPVQAYMEAIGTYGVDQKYIIKHLAPKLEISPPEELNAGDFTTIEQILHMDGTLHWALVGYTEGGYCSCTYYFEDLKKFMEDNPQVLE